MNQVVTILITALLPIVILGIYIYRKDSSVPEPVGQLVKAFVFGVISIFVSLCISIPFSLMGLFPDEPKTVLDSIAISFWGAAIPEEIAKFVMLWLVLRKNKYFDEKMDGIVYAVCVSLGFAALENVMYLFDNIESFVSVGITRGIFSVPGHFCFGVLMGYYYSLAKFYPIGKSKNWVLALIAPILVHGVYDSILFTMNVSTGISTVLFFVFLYFCFRMWKYGSAKIREHLDRDNVN